MVRPVPDITGQVFGRLTVIKKGHIHCYPSGMKRQTWTCRCECGVEKDYLPGRLKDGKAKSCGCMAAVSGWKHGLSKKSICNTYHQMKQRCNNPRSKSYQWYGAKGVQICSRWENSLEAFAADMGERPTSEHSIDRIDPFGNYEPSNCRWATRNEQMLNQRKNCAEVQQ